jgi:hypothetical protein
MKIEYRYAAVNRPPGYASVPDGYIRVENRPNKGEPFYELARHGFVIYDRELTLKELNSYELVKVFTEDETKNIIEKMLSAEYGFDVDYIEDYLKIAEEDFNEFRSMIGYSFELVVKKLGYYMHGIANLNQFFEQVLNKMREVKYRD